MKILRDVLWIVIAAFAIALTIVRIKTMHQLWYLSPTARRIGRVLCWIGIAWIALSALLAMYRLLVAAMRWLMA